MQHLINCSSSIYSFGELSGLLEPLNEESLSLFSIKLNVLGIEISRLVSLSLITPLSSIMVIERKLHGDLSLLFVHLEFFRLWCTHSFLHLDNLISVVLSIIENLPLFDGTLVHVDFLINDLLLANNILNPHFKINNDLSKTSIAFNTDQIAILVYMIHLIVL